jgi:molybdopterin-guanine dinucleotide biosynthesis protein A
MGAVILCGGQSSRMGVSKAMLPFGTESLLARAVRIVSSVAAPVVVVAAAGQELPEVPEDVRVVRDRRPGRGPLEGMLAGLAAIGDDSAATFVTSCDVPLLVPAFIERMASLLGDNDIAVPCIDGLHHPLAAFYRPRVIPHIEALLAADRLRPVYLYQRVPTALVTADELRDVDPRLASLRNVNRPEDYLSALAEAGFEAPPELLRALGRS